MMFNKISVVIPVYNEMTTIGKLLSDLENQQVGLEVIIVDGDIHGSTISCIQPDHYKSLYIRCITSSKGRGNQMRAGAALASTSLLWFLHSDTRVPAGAVVEVIHICSSRHISGGAFDLYIDGNKPGLKLVAIFASIRSRLTRIPYGDQGIFMKRSVYLKMGGMPDMPLLEDVTLMKHFKHQGYKLIISPTGVITSGRRWQKKGVLFVTLLNQLIIFAYKCKIPAARIAGWYR